ncbi:hypothetical protein PR202_ga23692 [Eleusine coracana subsp. coracana]|uniref:Glycosyltransferase 61 catalytic domain-containing protein n=1 Tax=Eleusine coracana subsp. coracana TaxID=191504 RepID=A0AAV5D5T7_ELECO|nr:hypothetical protein PR202_ga23692 [Eleusine coracana subsp. coracana]
MAFLVQHGGSRAVAGKAAAGARERKPRHGGARAAAKKNSSKMGHGNRQFAACLLALLVCICVVKLLPLLSSRISSGHGVHLVEGNLARHVSSDDTEGVGAQSSWQSSVVDGPQQPGVPILPRAVADPFRSSQESGTSLINDTVKAGTNLENKSGTEGQFISSAESDSPPGGSFMKPRQAAVTDIQISMPSSKIYCDDKSRDEGFPYARPIICQMSGDARVAPESSSIALTMPMQKSDELRRIRPYARQDDTLPPLVREVVIRAAASENDAPKCSVNHDVPAVIFSIGGYTGNFFHDMSDVLIPLYLTSFQFKGRHVTVGLLRDRDLIIRQHPTRNPKGYTMPDFMRFLRHCYGLSTDKPLVLGEQPDKKPRMLIISRRRTRKLMNLRRVAAMSRALGFDVVISEAGGNLKKFATMVNSCDVLVAVHGAGLTNQVFLPPQAVVIQIVPWGKMDWMATNFYGEPARGMNLRYLEYYISKEESSLIHSQGWNALSEMIMKQDVKLNLKRFKPTLLQALDLLQA